MRRALFAFVAAIALAVATPGPSAPDAGAYRLASYFWPDQRIPVPYCVNPMGIPRGDDGLPIMTPQEFVNEVIAAFDKWRAIGLSRIWAVYVGLCPDFPAGDNDDGVNAVGWGALAGPQVGLTRVRSLVSSREAIEADLILDNYTVRRIFAGRMDEYRRKVLPAILAHEAGHFLGLDHSPDPRALMYDTLPDGELIREPQADDIAGISALYYGRERAYAPRIADVVCDPTANRATVTFAWNRPPDREGNVGYWIDLTLDPFFRAFLNWGVGPQTDRLTWPGLIGGLPHYWRIYNVNPVANGYTPAPGFVTPRCYVGLPVPAGPSGLEASFLCRPDGSVTAVFRWNESLGATGYYVDLTLDPAFRAFLATPVGPGPGVLKWPGLIPGALHYWRVWAYNPWGGQHAYGLPFVTPVCR